MADIKLLVPVFLSVFLAELGDKTQIATMTFVAGGTVGKWGVFAAASAALVLSTFLGVLAGDLLGRVASPKALKISAGCLLLLMGLWTIWQGVRGAA
jgi:putative Ca2+/H+ antiporter (TMEM165/GDT1 family)